MVLTRTSLMIPLRVSFVFARTMSGQAIEWLSEMFTEADATTGAVTESGVHEHIKDEAEPSEQTAM